MCKKNCLIKRMNVILQGSSGEGTEASSVTAPSVSAPSVNESLEELEEPEETVTSREGKHIALQSLQFKR